MDTRNHATNDYSPIIIKKTSQTCDKPQSLRTPQMEKPIACSKFYLIFELRNVCAKIPLLQAIKEIPIYAKIVR